MSPLLLFLPYLHAWVVPLSPSSLPSPSNVSIFCSRQRSFPSLDCVTNLTETHIIFNSSDYVKNFSILYWHLDRCGHPPPSLVWIDPSSTFQNLTSYPGELHRTSGLSFPVLPQRNETLATFRGGSFSICFCPGGAGGCTQIPGDYPYPVGKFHVWAMHACDALSRTPLCEEGYGFDKISYSDKINLQIFCPSDRAVECGRTLRFVPLPLPPTSTSSAFVNSSFPSDHLCNFGSSDDSWVVGNFTYGGTNNMNRTFGPFNISLPADRYHLYEQLSSTHQRNLLVCIQQNEGEVGRRGGGGSWNKVGMLELRNFKVVQKMERRPFVRHVGHSILDTFFFENWENEIANQPLFKFVFFERSSSLGTVEELCRFSQAVGVSDNVMSLPGEYSLCVLPRSFYVPALHFLTVAGGKSQQWRMPAMKVGSLEMEGLGLRHGDTLKLVSSDSDCNAEGVVSCPLSEKICALANHGDSSLYPLTTIGSASKKTSILTRITVLNETATLLEFSGQPLVDEVLPGDSITLKNVRMKRGTGRRESLSVLEGRGYIKGKIFHLAFQSSLDLLKDSADSGWHANATHLSWGSEPYQNSTVYYASIGDQYRNFINVTGASQLLEVSEGFGVCFAFRPRAMDSDLIFEGGGVRWGRLNSTQHAYDGDTALLGHLPSPSAASNLFMNVTEEGGLRNVTQGYLPTGEWSHLCLSYSGIYQGNLEKDYSSHTLDFYLNGQKNLSLNGVHLNHSSLFGDSVFWKFGAFSSDIADVRIYNHFLSIPSVLRIFQSWPSYFDIDHRATWLMPNLVLQSTNFSIIIEVGWNSSHGLLQAPEFYTASLQEGYTQWEVHSRAFSPSSVMSSEAAQVEVCWRPEGESLFAQKVGILVFETLQVMQSPSFDIISRIAGARCPSIISFIPTMSQSEKVFFPSPRLRLVFTDVLSVDVFRTDGASSLANSVSYGFEPHLLNCGLIFKELWTSAGPFPVPKGCWWRPVGALWEVGIEFNEGDGLQAGYLYQISLVTYLRKSAQSGQAGKYIYMFSDREEGDPAEYGEGILKESPVLEVSAFDSRFKVPDGFVLLESEEDGPTEISEDGLTLNFLSGHALRFRLMTEPQGGRIGRGTYLKIALFPLTLWDVGDSCEATCVSITPGKRCKGTVICSAVATVFGWNFNTYSIRLPTEMDDMTRETQYVLSLLGVPAPSAGFFPTRVGVQLTRSPDQARGQFLWAYGRTMAVQPAVGSWVAKLYASSNPIPFKFQKGMLTALLIPPVTLNGTADTLLNVTLPEGYTCLHINSSSLPSDDWFSRGGEGGRTCYYSMPPGVVWFASLAINVSFTVVNPSFALSAGNEKNRWIVVAESRGEANQTFELTPNTFASIDDDLAFSSGIDSSPPFAGSLSVLGYIEGYVMPRSFLAETMQTATVFFRVEQTGVRKIRVDLPPKSFSEQSFVFPSYPHLPCPPLDEVESKAALTSRSTVNESRYLRVESCERIHDTRALLTLGDSIASSSFLYAFDLLVMNPNLTRGQGDWGLTTIDGNGLLLDQSFSPLCFYPSSPLGEVPCTRWRVCSNTTFPSQPEFFLLSRLPGIQEIRVTFQSPSSTFSSLLVGAPLGYIWQDTDMYYLGNMPLGVGPPIPQGSLLFFFDRGQYVPSIPNIFEILIDLPFDPITQGLPLWTFIWGFNETDQNSKFDKTDAPCFQVPTPDAFRIARVFDLTFDFSTPVVSEDSLITFTFYTTNVPKTFPHSRYEILFPPYLTLNFCKNVDRRFSYEGRIVIESCRVDPGSPLPTHELMRLGVRDTRNDTLGSDLHVLQIYFTNPPTLPPADAVTDWHLRYVDDTLGVLDDFASIDGYAVRKGIQFGGGMCELPTPNMRREVLRDDRPGRVNRLAFYFASPAKFEGKFPIEVRAPPNFKFSYSCQSIWTRRAQVLNQPEMPEFFSYWRVNRSYEALDLGVLGCKVGGTTGNVLQVDVSGGLEINQRKLFSVEVTNPLRLVEGDSNLWLLNIGDFSSGPVPGFDLWTLLDVQTSFLHNVQGFDNIAYIEFSNFNEVPAGGKVRVVVPSDFTIISSIVANSTEDVNEEEFSISFPDSQNIELSNKFPILSLTFFRLGIQVRGPEGGSIIPASEWRVETYEPSASGEFFGLDLAYVPGQALVKPAAFFWVATGGDNRGFEYLPALQISFALIDAFVPEDYLEIEGPQGELGIPLLCHNISMSPELERVVPICQQVGGRNFLTLPAPSLNHSGPWWIQRNTQLSIWLSTRLPSMSPHWTLDWWILRHFSRQTDPLLKLESDLISSYAFRSFSIFPQLSDIIVFLTGALVASGSVTSIGVSFIGTRDANVIRVEVITPSGFDLSLSKPYKLDGITSGTVQVIERPGEDRSKKFVEVQMQIASGQPDGFGLEGVLLPPSTGGPTFWLLQTSYEDFLDPGTKAEARDEGQAAGFDIPYLITEVSSSLSPLVRGTESILDISISLPSPVDRFRSWLLLGVEFQADLQAKPVVYRFLPLPEQEWAYTIIRDESAILSPLSSILQTKMTPTTFQRLPQLISSVSFLASVLTPGSVFPLVPQDMEWLHLFRVEVYLSAAAEAILQADEEGREEPAGVDRSVPIQSNDGSTTSFSIPHSLTPGSWASIRQPPLATIPVRLSLSPVPFGARLKTLEIVAPYPTFQFSSPDCLSSSSAVFRTFQPGGGGGGEEEEEEEDMYIATSCESVDGKTAYLNLEAPQRVLSPRQPSPPLLWHLKGFSGEGETNSRDQILSFQVSPLSSLSFIMTRIPFQPLPFAISFEISEWLPQNSSLLLSWTPPSKMILRCVHNQFENFYGDLFSYPRHVVTEDQYSALNSYLGAYNESGILIIPNSENGEGEEEGEEGEEEGDEFSFFGPPANYSDPSPSTLKTIRYCYVEDNIGELFMIFSGLTPPGNYSIPLLSKFLGGGNLTFDLKILGPPSSTWADEIEESHLVTPGVDLASVYDVTVEGMEFGVLFQPFRVLYNINDSSLLPPPSPLSTPESDFFDSRNVNFENENVNEEVNPEYWASIFFNLMDGQSVNQPRGVPIFSIRIEIPKYLKLNNNRNISYEGEGFPARNTSNFLGIFNFTNSENRQVIEIILENYENLKPGTFSINFPILIDLNIKEDLNGWVVTLCKSLICAESNKITSFLIINDQNLEQMLNITKIEEILPPQIEIAKSQILRINFGIFVLILVLFFVFRI